MFDYVNVQIIWGSDFIDLFSLGFCSLIPVCWPFFIEYMNIYSYGFYLFREYLLSFWQAVEAGTDYLDP